MTYPRLVFRVHAVQRMAERQVDVDAVRRVLEGGEVIADYPDDTPLPSRLVLGWLGDRPLHVVVGDNHVDRVTVVITVYEPDPTQWEPGFKSRRKP